MKNTYLLLILFLSTFNVTAQVTQLWSAATNTTGTTRDAGKDIAVDGSGNSYVLGTIQEGSGNYKLFVVKYNSSGVQQWTTTYDGPGVDSYDDATAIAVNAAGEVFILGMTNAGSTGTDLVTVKYDAAGVQQWAALYGVTGINESARALVTDAAGNVYITGDAYQAATAADIKTIKYNNSGVLQWQATYASAGARKDEARGIALDGSGNVIVAGISSNGTNDDFRTISYDNNGTQLWTMVFNGGVNENDGAVAVDTDASGNVFVTGYSSTGSYMNDYVTIKYTNTGTQSWIASFNGYSDTPTALKVGADGNVYVTGNINNANTDFATVKYNATGTQQWARVYNGTANGSDLAKELAVDASSNVYVAGVAQMTGSSFDYAVVKYNSAGTQQWVATVNGTMNNADVGNAMAIDNSGNAYVTGAIYNTGNNQDGGTAKITAAGAQEWIKNYDWIGNNSDVAMAIGLDAAGNTYVAGTAYAGTGMVDYLTAKYDNNGVQQWAVQYNGSQNDYLVGMVADAAGNSYVTGYSSIGSSFDFYTIKYNTLGVQQWAAAYSGTVGQSDTPADIEIDAAGNVYVTGSTSNGSNNDIVTIKYNNAGVQQWATIYATTSYEMVKGLTVDASGNVYVMGHNSPTGDNDFLVLKYSAAGVQQWAASFDGSGDSYEDASDIAVDASGNVYVTGTSYSAVSGGDYLTIKLNSSGVQQWRATYTGTGNNSDNPKKIKVDASGNVIVAGDSYTSTQTDYATVKYSAAGVQQWAAVYNGTGNGTEQMKDLLIDNSGNVYVTGSAVSTGSNNDYVTIKYNAAGQQKWTAIYDGTGGKYDIAYMLALDASGNVYVAGGATTMTGSDLGVVKYRQDLGATQSQTNNVCNGACNGTATVVAEAGTGPYTYAWSPSGGTAATASGLCAGTYTCTITDALGATLTKSFTITQGNSITGFNLSAQTNVSCFGGTNGAASVTAATGGAGGFTYDWTPGTPTGDGTRSVTGLTAGTWTVTTTDANGCTRAQSFTITQPPVISGVSASVQTNVACNGGATGAASVTAASGGAGSFTYNWSPGTPTGEGTTAITGLTAGTWTVAATDANGCTRAQTFAITQPPVISGLSAASQTNVACNGGATGAASVTAASGGAGSFTYNWSPGTPTGDGTTAVTGLTAGTWTVVATDANGCTRSQSFTITQSSAIAGLTPVSQTNVACNGGATGAASVAAATGGVGGFTYNWNPGTPSGDGSTAVTGLTAGTWTVVATDLNSCTRSQSFTITQPPVIAGLTPVSQTNVACNGGATGAASVTAATGGSGSFTYNWSPGTPSGDGTTTVTGLAAGTWTVVATDANGCTRSQSFTITEPPVLNLSASQTDISCAGGSNGSATISATGGSGSYMYSWSPSGGTGATASGLAAGTYTVTVTDQNGCTAVQSFTITEPTPLVAYGAYSGLTCYNENNGMAFGSAMGGAGNYIYNWSSLPSEHGSTVTGLAAGNYTLTVSDANGCSADWAFTIFGPSEPLGLGEMQTMISCNGLTDGSIAVEATGGYGYYTYNWGTAGGNVTAISDLAPGVYTVTATDFIGCAITRSYVITEPSLLTASATGDDILCHGGTTQVQVQPTGGTPGYTGEGSFTVSAGTSTFNVTDANGCAASAVITITEPDMLAAAASATAILCNGDSAAVTVTATGGISDYTGTGIFTVAAGTHTYTIADANGCTTTASTTVTQPDVLAATASATAILCNGDSAAVTVTATGGISGYAGTGIFTVAAGTHTYTIADANGCSTTASTTVTQPDVLAATASATAILCNGDSAAVTVTATGGISGYNGTGTFTVAAGTHTYTIADANGCSTTASTTVTQPDVLAATASATAILCNGDSAAVTVTATGGISDYTGTGTFMVAAGTHTYTIADANGCSTTASTTVTQPEMLEATASATAILCNGDSAAVTVTATGGISDYTGTGTFTVAAGAHTYTIADANGCTTTASATVTQPDVLAATASATAIFCNGDSAAVTVTATGGISDYTGTGTFTVAAGTHTYTIADANGCSTMASTTVTEPEAVTSAQTLQLCAGDTVTIGTSSYTAAGTYTDVLTTTAGCDSTVTTVIVMNAAPELAVTVIDNTLTSAENNASWQWIDCATHLPVDGATAQSFTPPANGNYAVIVSGTCTDTSECVAISTIGLSEAAAPVLFLVYPNPSNGIVTLETSVPAAVEVYDMLGKVIYTGTVSEGKNTLDLTTAATGIYTISAIVNGNRQTVRWSKN